MTKTTTRASQWRNDTVELDLPSGRDCEVRVVNGIAAISREGKIPDTLSAVLMETNQTGKFELKEGDQLNELMASAQHVAKKILVSPKVVDADPDEANDEVLIEDIPQNDLMFLFNWAMGGQGGDYDAAKSFPNGGQNGRVQPVQTGGDISTDPE